MATPRQKSASAFRTISEVSEELDVPQHVLRFWETKFSQIKPLKRGGRRRYYRPEDIDLLRAIKDLLYAKGYTIKGVQRLFREGTVAQHLNAELAETLDHQAAPQVRDSLPADSLPVGQSQPRYSPFTPDDILVTRESPDAISFNPSRLHLQEAIAELKSVREALAALKGGL